MKPTRTLVIGGTGFIGGHLVPYLIKSGRRVTVLARGKQNDYIEIAGVNHAIGDFADSDLLGALIRDADEVVHLAYASVPNTSFDDPLKDLSDNLGPAVNLMRQCSRNQAKLILISSGGAVYGQSQFLPISEDHPVRPISPYGVTKLTLEGYAYLYSVTHNLSYVCIRPSNPFGEGQRPFSGQGFIATAITSINEGKSVKIFGDTGNVRDYIYIEDLCAGILAAMEFGICGEAYNIGTGLGLNNLQVIDSLRPFFQKRDIKIEVLPKRIFDVQENILDSSRLRSISGWQPQNSLNSGLEKTVKFYQRSNS
jgi:UDP-glucose 4-epimerase